MDSAGSEPTSSTRHTNSCSPQPTVPLPTWLLPGEVNTIPHGNHSQATHPSRVLPHPAALGQDHVGTQRGVGRAWGTQRWGQAAAQSTQVSSILGFMEWELLGNACPTAGSPWPQARITLCSREWTLASPELSVQSPTSHFFCKACLESQCFMNQAPALPNTGWEQELRAPSRPSFQGMSGVPGMGQPPAELPRRQAVMCRLGWGGREGAASALGRLSCQATSALAPQPGHRAWPRGVERGVEEGRGASPPAGPEAHGARPRLTRLLSP